VESAVVAMAVDVAARVERAGGGLCRVRRMMFVHGDLRVCPI
jgi:hypothetical protein